MQPVSGVLSTQKARTPGWDSQHLYTGEALLTRLDTVSAEASFASSSELFPCSIRLATIRGRLCCSVVRGEKMWLVQILARCPVLLQFRQTTSADTLQSFTECTVLPQRLHFPLEERVCQLLLRGSVVWALVYGLASVLRLWGVSLNCVCLFVALFFATL